MWGGDDKREERATLDRGEQFLVSASGESHDSRLKDMKPTSMTTGKNITRRAQHPCLMPTCAIRGKRSGQ